MGVHLDLTDVEAEVLESVLEGVIGEMSSEIADTENPSFRTQLNQRRDALREVRRKLSTTL